MIQEISENRVVIEDKEWADPWDKPDQVHEIFSALRGRQNNEFWIDYQADEFLSIQYHSKTVIYWDVNEWEEDPETALSIANACKMAMHEPERFHRWLKGTE